MLKVRQIKVSVLDDNETTLKNSIAKKLRISNDKIKSFDITKKSIDARDKSNVLYVYEVNVDVLDEKEILKRNKNSDISIAKEEKYIVPKNGAKHLDNSIVIVGSGPAGLFSAYLLVENGYKVVLIERGECIENRVEAVEKFWQDGILNVNSNVQFGEGGAGTFSDGKLNTLVHDSYNRCKKVLETFVKFGAPKDILYLQKPHIGTDILRKVIVNMRNAIQDLGGKIYYNTCLTNLVIEDNAIKEIEINNKEKIPCENLILAIGHSARDTFELLKDKGLNMQAKPFAVGIRIQHLQKIINESQYGDFAKYLPPANYKLTYSAKNNRGVYSFCMCPGGYVVNASSENEKLAINGMSNYNRDSKNANSAIVVTVSPDDFGGCVLDGVNFQRELEKKAYILGKGSIPIQLYKDYCNNKISLKFGLVSPEIKGKYTFANLNDLFPEFINESLKEAIPNFGKKIKYFDSPDTIIAGVESRTSSPVKMIRDENYESNIKGIYPCGEGAGYAGGITTAAMDGIKVSESLIKKYSNK